MPELPPATPTTTTPPPTTTTAILNELEQLLMSNDEHVINLMNKYKYYYREDRIYTSEDVYKYAGNNDIELLRAALNCTSNTINWHVDTIDAYSHNFTAINVASRNGHFFAVEMLLDKGVDVNFHPAHGETPLMSATTPEGRAAFTKKWYSGDGDRDKRASGHLNVVRLLLDRGADVNIHHREGSALHRAAMNGYLDIVALLIERGADVDAPLIMNDMIPVQSYECYGTALEMATFYNYVDIVVLLLDKGATIKGAVLARAIENRSIESVMLLLENCTDIDLNQPDKQGATALMSATHRDITLLKILLSKGANVNYVNRDNHTALSKAISNKSMEACLIILNYGTDINIGNGIALKQAANQGSTEFVRMLLDRGAAIYDIDEYEYKPSYWDSLDENYGNKNDHRPMIIDELEVRRKRAVFDSFITHHIEYAPYLEAIYSTCCPYPRKPDADTDTTKDTDMYTHKTQCRLTRSKPAVGWIRALAIRDKYYYDEVFFYLHMHVAKVVRSLSSSSISMIAVVANSSDDISTLMIVLSDRLMMYLKPPAL